MTLRGGMINRSEIQQEALEVGSEMRFAAASVTALCKALKVSLPTKASRDRDFGFNWFRDAYPGFPVFMEGINSELNLVEFWVAPTRTEVWDSYFKLLGEYRRETMGLIVVCKGVGKLVLHNAWSLNPVPGHTRLERRNRVDKTKGLVVESVEAFAESVLQVWSP